MKRPGQEGGTWPGLLQPPRREAQLSIASAIGASKTPIEHARAHLALVLAFEQRAASVLVAPAMPRLVRRAVEDHAVVFNAIDVRAAQRVMSSTAFRVRLGEDEPVDDDPVDRADWLPVAADH